MSYGANNRGGGYPAGVRRAAIRGIKRNKQVNNRCATQVGKVRAQQLAKGEPLSAETRKRMISYLRRAETYYDPSHPNACGTISYDLWGGKMGLKWMEDVEGKNVRFRVGINYLNVSPRRKQLFVPSTYYTRPVPGEDSVKVVYGKLKVDPKGKAVIHKYIFDLREGWTAKSALEWFRKQGD